MADPRGLSGAVFQPTQIRDFTQDLLVSNQYKAKKEAASQKALQDDLEEYNTGTINNGYHIQAVEKSIIPKIKELTLLKAEAKQNGDRDAEMKYNRQLTGVTNNFKGLVKQMNRFDKFSNENYDNLQTALSDGYAGEEFINSVNQMNILNNEGIRDAEIEIDENGDIFFNGVPQGELLRPQILKSEKPYDLRSDIVDYYSVKKRDGIIDRSDILKELNRAKGSQRQQKQFYTYLKEQKGYDEDRIQSAIEADSEGLVEEFYEYATGELMSEKDETTKTEKEGGDGVNEKWKTTGRVGDGTYGKALFLPKDKIKFDLKEFVDDGTNSAELVTDATIISLQPNKNGDNILAEISYLKEDGFKEFDFVPLTADQESIVAAGLGLPDNVSIRDFYQSRVGGATANNTQKPQAEKKSNSEVYLYEGSEYTIEELKSQYGDDFNPLEYEQFQLKK